MQALSVAALLARDYHEAIIGAVDPIKDCNAPVTVSYLGLQIVRDRNTLKWILQQEDLKNWAELQEMYRNNADGILGGEPCRFDPPNATTMPEPAPEVVAELLAEANERRARRRIYASPVIKAIRAGMIADGIPIHGLVYDPVAAM